MAELSIPEVMPVRQPARAHMRPRPRRRSRAVGGYRRLLLMLTVIVMPLQDHLPAIAGTSMLFIAFAVLALHALLLHPRELARAAGRPVFMAAYVMLASGFLVEIAHPGGTLEEWGRIAQMVAGAVVIASYCRTPRDVRAALFGFLIASIWISIFLLTKTYGQVSAAAVLDFEEASILRAQTAEEVGLRSNWNFLAFMAGAGAAIAASRAIWARSWAARWIYTGAALLGVLGTTMTFSRSGFLGMVGGVAVAAFSAMKRRTILRTIALMILTAAVLWFLVPASVRARFSFEGAVQGTESRGFVYRTSIALLPQYYLFGVGAQEFWDSWAVENGLHLKGLPLGSHNIYLQIWIYWGLAGLMTLLGLTMVALFNLRQAAKRMPAEWRELTAFATVMFLWALVMHNLYAKEFSIALGLIAAAHAISRRQPAHPVRRVRRAPAH